MSKLIQEPHLIFNPYSPQLWRLRWQKLLKANPVLVAGLVVGGSVVAITLIRVVMFWWRNWEKVW